MVKSTVNVPANHEWIMIGAKHPPLRVDSPHCLTFINVL